MSEYDLTWNKFAVLVKNGLDPNKRQAEIEKEWQRMSLTSTQKRKTKK